MKNILFSIFFLIISTSPLYGDQWELWLDSGMKGCPFPKIELSFDQELRIKNNVQRFGYVQLDPTVLFKYHKNTWAGFQWRQIFERNNISRDWDPEEQPNLVLKNSTGIGTFKFYSTLRLLYRIRKDRNILGAIRFRPGIDLITIGSTTIYAENEFFYNYNGFQQYDQNRVSFGIRGTLLGPLEWGVYYLHQSNKPFAQATWSNVQVIGLILRAKI